MEKDNMKAVSTEIFSQCKKRSEDAFMKIKETEERAWVSRGRLGRCQLKKLAHKRRMIPYLKREEMK